MLTPQHEELLNRAFGNQNWHIDRKLTGYSGASVYQVTHQNNPVIVKIAHADAIQREFRAYRDFVRNQLRNIVPFLSEQPIYSADGQEALLQYTYAGVRQSQTLFEYLQSKGSKAIYIILDELFHVHGDSWWGNGQKVRGVTCRKAYDRMLPAHLQLTPFTAMVDNPHVLDANSIDDEKVAKIETGDVVRLENFKVEKAEDGIVTLYAQPDQGSRIRFKLAGAQGNAEDIFAPTDAFIKETRKTLLEKYAKSVVPNFGVDSSHFMLDGHVYHNPIYYLDKLLNTPYTAKVSTIHGDLNLRNILIEGDPRKQHHLWLIDFASTQPGPVLLDLQWLETQVILWLLAPAIQEAKLKPQVLITVLEALHKQRELPWHLRYWLQTPYRVLQAIRRLAEEYLAAPQEAEERWCEYYLGLTIALVGMLKHNPPPAEVGEDAKKFALIGAATTLLWAGIKLPEQKKQRNEQWIRYVVIGGAGALLLLSLFYTIGPPLPPNPTPTPLAITTVPGSAAPVPTTRTVQFLLSSTSGGDTPWINTGVEIRPGAKFTVTASGKINVAFHRMVQSAMTDTLPIFPWIGPNGLGLGDNTPPHQLRQDERESFNYLIAPDIKRIGRIIGIISEQKPLKPPDTTQILSIGDKASFTNAKSTGTLWLTVNEVWLRDNQEMAEFYSKRYSPQEWEEKIRTKNYWNVWYDDNVGEFLVTIEVEP